MISRWYDARVFSLFAWHAPPHSERRDLSIGSCSSRELCGLRRLAVHVSRADHSGLWPGRGLHCVTSPLRQSRLAAVSSRRKRLLQWRGRCAVAVASPPGRLARVRCAPGKAPQQLSSWNSHCMLRVFCPCDMTTVESLSGGRFFSLADDIMERSERQTLLTSCLESQSE
uniref:Uncharacterized protein n=1 Tax=Prymnesium polylepis TaxID=72548 RepID=A0A7S4M2N5_9EUKA